MTSSVNDGGLRTEPVTGGRLARLAGPSRAIDRRINAVRDDLADATLAGVVVAPRYAEGVFARGTRAVTLMRARPDGDAVAVSALLYGEVVTIFDVGAGWAWAQCLHDGYVGWLPVDALEMPVGAIVTHWVAVPSATVFAAADIKSPVVRTLPLNARLVGSDAGAFVAAAGGFVHRRHVREITDVGSTGESHGDAAGLATGFLGTPYVWGGRSRDGIDCSGLVQAVLRAGAVFFPRDSDQQAAAFAVIDEGERRRGDLVVFPGHVGILADPDTLIHANAYWMTTLAEPLAAVAERVTPSGFRRPPVIAASSC